MNALMNYAKNTYANDPRFKIAAYAFGRGWDVFDHEGDLRNIPSRLNNSSLDQTQVSDVAPLQHLKQLATYTDSAATAQRWRAEGLGVRLHFK